MRSNSIRVRKAESRDLDRTAEIFFAAFPESIAFYLKDGSKPLAALSDIFRIFMKSDGDAFLIAEAIDLNQVAGYIMAPAAIQRIWVKAVLNGSGFRVLWKFLFGKYNVSLKEAFAILRNKGTFMTMERGNHERNQGRILSLAVDPAFQGKGIGGMLLDAGLDHLRQSGAVTVMLEVRANNKPACRLYKSRGFMPVGTTKDQQGEWTIMKFQLD